MAAKRTKAKAELPEDFDFGALMTPAEVHRPSSAYAWKPAAIKQAIQAHRSGIFATSDALIDSVVEDGAIFRALLNRCAPLLGLPRRIVPAFGKGHAFRDNGKAERVAADADSTFIKGTTPFLSPGTLADIGRTLAMANICIAQNIWTRRSDGYRIDVRQEIFPLRSVSYIAHEDQLYAQTNNMGRVPINHGDGRWVVYQRCDDRPWRFGAIVALGMVWQDRRFGVRDRANAAQSHGSAKVVGTLPEKVRVRSPEGKEFFELLKKMHETSPVGIKPFGSALDFLVSNSSAWQIFRDIVMSNASDAEGILLGSNGTASEGGNYIKSGYLFGVRNDIVETDVGAIMRGYSTGTLRPWTQYNFADLSVVPSLEIQMPDADKDRRRQSLAENITAFLTAIENYRKQGFVVNQEIADRMANDFEVPTLELAEAKPTGGGEFFQYDLELGVVTINEARARKGLEPIEGGDLTMPQQAAIAAKETALAAAPEPTAVEPEPEPAQPDPEPEEPDSDV